MTRKYLETLGLEYKADTVYTNNDLSNIKEEIPDAKQIADRFHQHQNFLQVIKKCINTSFPQTIRIENKDNKHETCTAISSKKSLFDVDNLTDYQRKRYELLTNIQKWLHQILVIKILL